MSIDRYSTSDTAWHELGDIYRYSSTWEQLGRVYRYSTFTSDWEVVFDLALSGSISHSVDVSTSTGLTGGTVPLGVSTHEVTWTKPTTWPDVSYLVRVQWFLDGSPDTTDVVASTVGLITREYDSAYDVYGEVAYRNNNGDGPETQTNTV